MKVETLSLTYTAESGVSVNYINCYKMGNLIKLKVRVHLTTSKSNNNVIIRFTSSNFPKPKSETQALMKCIPGDGTNGVGCFYIAINSTNIQSWGITAAGQFYLADFTYLI